MDTLFCFYGKSLINPNWYIFSESILLHALILKPVRHDNLFRRVNNPIFPDASLPIIDIIFIQKNGKWRC